MGKVVVMKRQFVIHIFHSLTQIFFIYVSGVKYLETKVVLPYWCWEHLQSLVH
jgi:hypothetical protein